MDGAQAVAVCVALNDQTADRIDKSLIDCLHCQARVVCVAKPDVFSRCCDLQPWPRRPVWMAWYVLPLRRKR